MTKILIVNPFGIGDVLFTTPLIAALKEHISGVTISFIGNVIGRINFHSQCFGK